MYESIPVLAGQRRGTNMVAKVNGAARGAVAAVASIFEVQLVVLWVAARVAAVRSDDKDRGELLEKVVITAIFVAAAIVVGVVLVNKAKKTANGVKTE